MSFDDLVNEFYLCNKFKNLNNNSLTLDELVTSVNNIIINNIKKTNTTTPTTTTMETTTTTTTTTTDTTNENTDSTDTDTDTDTDTTMDSTKDTTMKYAFLYTRTSNTQICEKNVSIDVQQIALIKYCYNNNILIKDIYVDDGKSAKNMTNQKELSKLKRDVLKFNIYDNTAKKYVMIYDISRFSRNTLQALQLLDILSKNNINLYFLSENLYYDNPYNKHSIRTQLSTSQYISEYTSDRVKKSLFLKKSKGEHIGTLPFGYKRNALNKLEVNKDELRILKHVKKAYNMFSKMKNQPRKYINEKILTTINKTNCFRGQKFTLRRVSLCLRRLNEIENNSYKPISL